MAELNLKIEIVNEEPIKELLRLLVVNYDDLPEGVKNALYKIMVNKDMVPRDQNGH